MDMKKPRPKAPRAAESVTPYGETRVMIADLKAHLSRHLRTVRAGGTLTILDRDTPIARVVPVTGRPDRLVVRPATKTWAEVAPLLAKLKPLKLPVDSLTILRELRKDRV